MLQPRLTWNAFLDIAPDSIDNDGDHRVTVTEFMSFLRSKDVPVAKGRKRVHTLGGRARARPTAPPSSAATRPALSGRSSRVVYGRHGRRRRAQPKKLAEKTTLKQAIKGTVAAGRMRAFGVDDEAVLRGLARARRLCDKGKSREAIKTIDMVLEEWPNLGQEIKCGIYVLKSVCMAKVGDAWSALQFAEHAVQQDSESVRAQQRRSAAQMALGRPSNAILGLFKSLQKEPTSSRLRADFDTCQSQIKTGRPFRNEITRHATEYPPANHDGKPPVIVVKKEEPPELAPLDEEWKSK